jgi:hypothetical protein
MKPIGEGIQSLVARKRGFPTVETHLIRPSTTIILGQNSPDISHRVWEICDLSIAMKIDTFNGHQSLKCDQIFEGTKLSSSKTKRDFSKNGQPEQITLLLNKGINLSGC